MATTAKKVTVMATSLVVYSGGSSVLLPPHLKKKAEKKTQQDCTNVQDICIDCNQRDYLDFWKSLDHLPRAIPLQCLREGKREQVMFLTTQASLAS